MMGTYATTATILALVKRAEAEVTVNRNLEQTSDGLVVRLDVDTNAPGDSCVSVALSLDTAEELAVAILDAAGLLNTDVRRPNPIGGRRFPGRPPVDAALAEVEQNVRDAKAAGAGGWSILSRVANGLTGHVSGYVERAATWAMLDAFNATVSTPVEQLKSTERARDTADNPNPLRP